MFKKFLLIISLFTIFNQSAQTFAEIIPIKKPIQSKKEKIWIARRIDIAKAFVAATCQK